MGLREELNKIDPEDAILALSGQVVSDPPDAAHKLIDRAEWYSERLQEYPVLDKIFRHVTSIALGSEHASKEHVKAVLTGAGIALLGVKAVANSQIFESLEAPPDIEV
jgi:hypothetical protein